MNSYYGKRSKRSVNQLIHPNDLDYFEPRAADGRAGIVLILLGTLVMCAVGAVVAPAGLGAFVGYQDLLQQNQENANLHFQRGVGYLAENYPELAYSEFGIALKYDPTNEPARQKYDELSQSFGGKGTRGASESNVAPALYEQAKNFVAKKQWSEAVLRLEQLRTLNKDYRAAEVNDLLYDAYVQAGKESVALAQIELARERFDAALAIKNGDPEIKRQRDLAKLYLEGQQYAGTNWQTAAQKFDALYAQEPNYADVKKRVAEAHSAYGDNAAKTNAWCLALREYDAAVAVSNDAALADKRRQAATNCKQLLTSPPTPTLAPTDAYTWKILPPGTATCAGAGDLSGAVRDAAGKGITGLTLAYTTDSGARTTTKTNGGGAYQFALGKDAGTLRVFVAAADGKTPASAIVDVNYPGGSNANCHLILDWQKAQ